MQKVLWVIAVVAAVALGTSVVSTIVLHSALAKDARELSVLKRAESVDQSEIAKLRERLHPKKTLSRDNSAKTSHASVTAARPSRAEPQPMGQPGFAVASPEFSCTIRHDSLTAWNALAGMPLSSDTSASGHCGYALPWKYQLLPLSARINP
jgi:hypothetical protein